MSGTGRENQLHGAHGEQLASSVLVGMGVNDPEKIGTPVQLTPYFKYGKKAPEKGVFRVKFGEKVSGDRRGVLDNGISVLIEVKTLLDKDRIIFSDMRDHQPERLARHASYGKALSLLVWVHSSGVYAMRFPIAGFGPGKSIKLKQAIDLHFETTKWIRENGSV